MRAITHISLHFPEVCPAHETNISGNRFSNLFECVCCGMISLPSSGECNNYTLHSDVIYAVERSLFEEAFTQIINHFSDFSSIGIINEHYSQLSGYPHYSNHMMFRITDTRHKSGVLESKNNKEFTLPLKVVMKV